MADELLPVILPVALYWVGSGIYAILWSSMEKHRMFTKEEEDIKNLVTRRQALVGVLLNQLLQITAFALTFMVKGGTGDGNVEAAPPPTSLLRLAGQLCVAVVVFDAWDYFYHRLAHENKFLYKHVHSHHHRLIAPFAFAAQYQHPVDSFFGETIAGVLATSFSGMSAPTAAFFFSVAALKSLDDHSGLWFPNSPISRLFGNNSALHALHHQHYGIKYNYSVFFLTLWDRLLGTYMPYSIEEKEGGGYLLRAATKDD